MKKIFLIVIVFFSFLFSSYTTNINTNNKNKTDTLTEENVYLALIVSGIKYPVVVLCQMILETGHLTSEKCTQLNNLMGMKVPKYRKTTCISDTGYAKYFSWFESVLDYKYYQEAILSTGKIHNEMEYLNYLQKHYAENKNYKKKLLSMRKIYAKKTSLIDTLNIFRNTSYM